MSAAQKIDFSAINDAALSKPFYLQSLLPHARVEGREFVAGDIQGSPGKSFKVNLDTGKWADFATGECGGDIISLVSAQGGIKQGEAARLIADNLALTRPAPPPLARKRKELLECPAVKENLKQHFSYRNADGSKLFCVFRYERHGYRKSIRQGVFRDGEIKFGIGDTKRVIYQLPEVLKSTLVIIVEGENKVVALENMGLCATCNPGGAGKWEDEYSTYLADKDVFILPDNDEPGKAHAAKVAASVAPVAASVKIVELPGLPHKGDVIDWLNVPGNDKQQLLALMNDAPLWKTDAEEIPADGPFDFDWKQHTGAKYLHNPAPAFDFLLDDAFVRGDVGLFAGLPGSGKGTFALGMAVHIAAGMPVYDFWRVSRPGKVMYLSCEDSETIIHHRIQNSLAQLPERCRNRAAENIIAVSLCGSSHLITSDKRGQAKATENLFKLEKIIKDAKPDLLFLDTLSRFIGVDEIDNAAITAAIGLIEKIARENSCSIIFIHHTNKDSQTAKSGIDPVAQALNQSAIRGASALAGCVRFAANFLPLPQKAAKQYLGNGAGKREDETFIAVRCVKKNIGPPEQMFFVEKRDFHIARVLPLENGTALDGAKEESLLGDVEKLVAEVRRREEAGEKPLSVSRGCRETFGWRDTRSRKVVERAIDRGDLMTADGAKGTVLKIAPEPDPMDMFDFSEHGTTTVHADPRVQKVPNGEKENPTVHADTVADTPLYTPTVHATLSHTVHADPRVQSLSYGEKENLLYTGGNVHGTPVYNNKVNDFSNVTVHGHTPL